MNDPTPPDAITHLGHQLQPEPFFEGCTQDRWRCIRPRTDRPGYICNWTVVRDESGRLHGDDPEQVCQTADGVLDTIRRRVVRTDGIRVYIARQDGPRPLAGFTEADPYIRGKIGELEDAGLVIRVPYLQDGYAVPGFDEYMPTEPSGTA